MLHFLLAQTRFWLHFRMKEDFIFTTASLFHKLASTGVALSSSVCLVPSLQHFQIILLPLSRLCSPLLFPPSGWFITDWLLLSPEGGGHTVQLTQRAPGPPALPHTSPLLLQWPETWDLALHVERWASSCVLTPEPLPLWLLEILSFRKVKRLRWGLFRTIPAPEVHRYFT